MSIATIGGNAQGADAQAMVKTIGELEARGIHASWLTGGPGGFDSLTTFSAAAAVTSEILLGTCITPTWPRHPIIAAQQVRSIANLAKARFRFGIGPSHRSGMERRFGVNYRTPLTALREYMTIVRSLLETGCVDFDGAIYKAHTEFGGPTPGVPVLMSALREPAYKLAGEISDGAISWVSPGTYLRDFALPAMEIGAKAAGRRCPPLFAHVPIAVHENLEEVRVAVREQLAMYPKAPFYQAMFAAAGFPEAAELAGWSDGMIEATVFSGTESQVAERLEQLSSWGVGEIIVNIVAAGSNPQWSRDRTLDFLGHLSTGSR